MSLKEAFNAGAQFAAGVCGAQAIAPEAIAEAYAQWREGFLAELAGEGEALEVRKPDPLDAQDGSESQYHSDS